MFADAMVGLLAEHRLADLSVGDIAKQAGLNRATFYLHYRDKFDLLEQLVEEMHEGLARDAQLQTLDLTQLDVARPPAVMGVWIAQIAAQRLLYRALLEYNGAPALARDLGGYFAEFMQVWAKQAGHDPRSPAVPTAIVSQYLASAYIGVIAQWLRHPQATPDELGRWLWQLTLPALLAGIGASQGILDEPRL